MCLEAAQHACTEGGTLTQLVIYALVTLYAAAATVWGMWQRSKKIEVINASMRPGKPDAKGGTE